MSIVHNLSTHPDFSAQVTMVAAKAAQALPSTHGRIDRAVELVLAGCVEPLGAGRWEVASQSTYPDRWYLVAEHTCTCPDFAQRSVEDPQMVCKHLLATWLYRRAVQAIEKEEIMNTSNSDDPYRPMTEDEYRCWMAVDDQGTPCHTAGTPCPGHPELLPQAAGIATETQEVQSPTQTPVNLPEAPVSINCTVTIQGRNLMVTIRDTDEERAMERMLALLAKYSPKDAKGDASR